MPDTPIENITVDTSEVEQRLQALQEHANITVGTVLDTTNKAFQTVALLGEIMGIAIPQWMVLMYSAIYLAAKEVYKLGVAFAAGTAISPIMAVKSAIVFGIAAAMFYQAQRVRHAEKRIQSQLTASLQILNLWSPRG